MNLYWILVNEFSSVPTTIICQRFRVIKLYAYVRTFSVASCQVISFKCKSLPRIFSIPYLLAPNVPLPQPPRMIVTPLTKLLGIRLFVLAYLFRLLSHHPGNRPVVQGGMQW